MRLPISFFDSKKTGDILQRISDHERIQAFLTNSVVSIPFSAVTLLVFGMVLLFMSPIIFSIFLVGAVIYIIWIILFLERRRKIDYLEFQQLSDNQDALIEIIQGMSEIKLQNSEYKRRWGWTSIQAKLFNTQIAALSVEQWQDAGGILINQIKDVFISYIAARSVVEGNLTLGAMMAIQYIVGQVNAPLNDLIHFIRAGQDARISLERLNEVNEIEPEDTNQHKIGYIPKGDISIENLSFKYTQMGQEVLSDINITIPRNKVTAIVGTSGSGKTTLLKLLLGFYQPTSGKIRVGNSDLHNIDQKKWRKACGAVLQDGFIFSDSIANNIAESDDSPDLYKLLQSTEVANLTEFIEALPLGLNTIIGAKGAGISQGQRQRVLIARAVYKGPLVLFFDEATNALDANNEKIIMENLNIFFENRTVIVVAHRLSTVKNADQIIVLDNGKLVEQGTHASLTKEEGQLLYFGRKSIRIR